LGDPLHYLGDTVRTSGDPQDQGRMKANGSQLKRLIVPVPPSGRERVCLLTWALFFDFSLLCIAPRWLFSMAAALSSLHWPWFCVTQVVSQ
jgi:hypothetical protein